MEIIESTDNDLSAPLRCDDDTGDEVEDDCGRREYRVSVMSTASDHDGRSGSGGGREEEGGKAMDGRSEEKDDGVKDAYPDSASIVAVGVPLTEAGAPAEEPRSVESSKNDALRHQWPLAVSPGMSMTSLLSRKAVTGDVVGKQSKILNFGMLNHNNVCPDT